MAGKRPTTIPEYIQAAPPQSRPHLRTLYKILKSVAPKAEEAIKWGAPFFVEPRFLFSFSAFKAHCAFVPSQAALKAFAKELKAYETTANFFKIPYDEPVPEALVRRIAKWQVKAVRERKDDAFW
jgi:uncharacterized protein YdhG (YjbR/CyaY superfamily)